MRTFDASIHNRLVNLPEVKPHFAKGVEGFVDLTQAVEAIDDYIFLHDGPDAAAVFEWCGPGIFQSHYLMAPSHRGRAAVSSAQRMAGWMLDHHARILWGNTPVTNKGARWLNRQIGAISRGFRTFEADGHCELFTLERNS